MIRALALLGMVGVFLSISPRMREAAGGVALQAEAYLSTHGLFGYVTAAAAALTIMFLVARTARAPR